MKSAAPPTGSPAAIPPIPPIPHCPCGASGLRLSRISLGTYYNFGPPERGENATHGLPSGRHEDNARSLIQTAFDAGVTHFDTADCYGSEELLGTLLAEFPREEVVIGSKAGYGAPRARGGGSRAHLIERCERSLKAMRLDYLDIFTHHCPDPSTPIEETLWTLDFLVRTGKARYTGVSSFGYGAYLTEKIARLCRENGWVQPVYHQTGYNLLERRPEEALLDICQREGIGFCAMTPLAHGRLTDKYLREIPAQSRRAKTGKTESLHPELLSSLRNLGELAASRGQTIAQCSLAFALAESRVCTVLLGASRPDMLAENLDAIRRCDFSEDERALLSSWFPPGQMSPHFEDF